MQSCVEKRVLRAKCVQDGTFTLITGSVSQAWRYSRCVNICSRYQTSECRFIHKIQMFHLEAT